MRPCGLLSLTLAPNPQGAYECGDLRAMDI
jgi:hypothetical protein